ncbi:GTPase-binding protein rid1 [Vanrija pseudolonga]|uniref:GTPase-binding protein rid1 n=1 Tax=Vanrija pseudolonga TaxID=143232 RepID=A0AAF0YIG5_9TREE|nr:GTPase-binding protein rid1 [Vanrija pseudolonga]
MPPPAIPAASSVSSASSSRPSLSMSDVSTDSINHPGQRADERIKTPLQDITAPNREDVDAQFDSLLDMLEVPSTVRLKFGSVAKDVKQSILDSSSQSNPAILASLGLPVPQTPDKKVKKASTPFLRKAKSSTSLGPDSPQAARRSGPVPPKTLNVDGDQFVIVASPKIAAPTPSRHQARGYSIDIGRPGSRPVTSRPNSLFAPPSPSPELQATEGPDAFVHWLSSHKGTDLSMEVNRAKKLRMLLRHETTGWVATFIEAGGYKLVLDRLQDLLDVEWREEQHDDQMLYELLRCVKALTTSDVGKAAIRAAHPRPFPALSALLFSEKKPGDIPCRLIMVELFIFHFELFPSRVAKAPGNSTVRFETSPADVDVTEFVRQLLMPAKENKAADYHEFVTVAHRPRVFKSWVQELSDICRDYFWIMCHGNNTLWNLDQVDEKVVERPVAPGGATGGVEFEAMGYVTMHFRLLNDVSSHLAGEDAKDAQKFHTDLIASGLDRILVTMRKASTTYYPTLHLEMARYVDHLKRACPGDKMPYLIHKMIGSPPEEFRKHASAGEWLPRTQWK